MIFWGEWANGLWIAFIGWFLESAAAGSYRQLAIHEILQGHTVSEVMVRGCPSISLGLTVEQVVQEYILVCSRRCFPVVDGNRVLGMVTMHNVKAVPREFWSTRRVREIMTPFDQIRS